MNIFKKIAQFLYLIPIVGLGLFFIAATSTDRDRYDDERKFGDVNQAWLIVQGASNTAQSKPINVSEQTSGYLHIYNATGVPLSGGGVLEATVEARQGSTLMQRRYWIEGKPGRNSTASTNLQFTTLPIEVPYKEQLVDGVLAMAIGAPAVDAIPTKSVIVGVTSLGLYKVDLTGISFVRICMAMSNGEQVTANIATPFGASEAATFGAQ